MGCELFTGYVTVTRANGQKYYVDRGTTRFTDGSNFYGSKCDPLAHG